MLKKHLIPFFFVLSSLVGSENAETQTIISAPESTISQAESLQSPFKIVENPSAPNLIQKGILFFKLVQQKQHANFANFIKLLVAGELPQRLFDQRPRFSFRDCSVQLNLVPVITKISQRFLIDQNGIKHAAKKGFFDYLKFAGFYTSIYTKAYYDNYRSEDLERKLFAKRSIDINSAPVMFLNMGYLYKCAGDLLSDFEKECKDKKITPEVVYGFFPPSDNFLTIYSLNQRKIDFLIALLPLVLSVEIQRLEKFCGALFSRFSRDMDLCRDLFGKIKDDNKSFAVGIALLSIPLASKFARTKSLHIPYKTLHQLSPELQERFHDFMWIQELVDFHKHTFTQCLI